MTSDNPLYYWDSCIFLAWLKNEKRKPGELAGVKDMVVQIQKNKARLITSQLTQSEILKSTLSDDAKLKLSDAFKRRNVMQVATDNRVWELVYEIRDYYQTRKDIDGLPTLTIPDAVHLSTAILYKVDALYTFDEKDHRNKRRGLLPLSGNVAGKYKLLICKPMTSQLDLL